MKITVKRFKELDKCTVGRMEIEGSSLGFYTLEDKVREKPGFAVDTWKVPGETAIPRGQYRVIISFSEHFQKDLPLLIGVPGFEGVRIHPGNTSADTEGCLLVGSNWTGGDFIGGSRDAFLDVFALIKAAGEVCIEVS